MQNYGVAERFYVQVNFRGPRSLYAVGRCYLWTGARNSADVYGVFMPRVGKNVSAHTMAWTLSGREVPSGYELDHRCRKQLCVRVSHMQVVTPQMNMYLAMSRRNTCKAGHDRRKHGRYYLAKSGKQMIYCQRCNTISARRRRAKAGTA